MQGRPVESTHEMPVAEADYEESSVRDQPKTKNVHVLRTNLERMKHQVCPNLAPL